MSTDYNYDDQGQFFPYFILTISGLVTIPLTYSLLKPSQDLENTASRIQSDFKPQDAELIDGQKRKQRRRERRLKRILTVVVGWLMMGWMIYLIMVTARALNKIWDPYEILDISRSADEKAIKSHYKRLSLKFHPDKIRPDPARNQTTESLNQHFVELTKAYKALTDDEVRNNFIQYGHPDGKQSFSIGIALPKFIVTDGNGKYVLMLYGLLLGVLLPYVVGKWWYGTQRMTKDRVLFASAGKLFREYQEDLTEGGVVGALSSGEEYKEILSGNRAEHGSSRVEAKVLGHATSVYLAKSMTVGDRKKLQAMTDPVRRKTLALLWAYLGRTNIGDVTLDDEKYALPPIALTLNDSLLAITLAFAHTPPILSSFHTSQNLIQALPPGASPLLQLPHITPEIASSITSHSALGRDSSIQAYLALPDPTRRRISISPSLLTTEQYHTAISVARQLPHLVICRAFFKVTGEKHITPNSLVQFVIKARFIPPGSTSIPDVKPSELEDLDPDEGDVDAILGRPPSKRKLAAQKAATEASPASDGPVRDTTPIQPPLAHAPFFPRDHSPRWHIFLTDAKQNRIAVPPFTFSTFPNPIFHPTSDNQPPEPTFAMQTLKMQFQAPPGAGQYTFVMHMVCDSYKGFDEKREIVLLVEGEEMAAEIQGGGVDEISEPDEDSIAGQMQSLKNGGLSATSGKSKGKKPSTKRPAVSMKRRSSKATPSSADDEGEDDDEEEDGSEDDEDEDEDEDSGSDTDGEEGEEESETDTDTDTDED